MLIDLLACHPEPFRTVLKTVLVGGAPTEAELLQRARSRGLPVLPTWGMTEAGSQLVTPEPARAAVIDFIRSPNWVGRPLSGVEVRVADDGRLQVRGPMLFSGTLDAPSRAPDDEGWYTTGDRGRIDADGELTITGRAGRTLISGGINVNLDAVERRLRAAIAEIESTPEIALIAVADARWGQRIVAAVVAPDAGNNRDPLPALQDWARRNLDPAERPARWHRLPQLPRTSAGKIAYAELARRIEAEAPDEP
jgi:O-succinylbenzoic acid--CoA ligase